jgi:hypothetical protein
MAPAEIWPLQSIADKHFSYKGPSFWPPDMNITVSGNIYELDGHPFDFYIFGGNEYENWLKHAYYHAYLEKKNIISETFSFRVGLYEARAIGPPTDFVIVNHNNEPIIVEVSATIEWDECTNYGEYSFRDYLIRKILGPSSILLGIIFLIVSLIALLT